MLRAGPAGIVEYPSHGIVLDEDIGDKAMLAGISCDVAECFQQGGANSALVLFVRDKDGDLGIIQTDSTRRSSLRQSTRLTQLPRVPRSPRQAWSVTAPSRRRRSGGR